MNFMSFEQAYCLFRKNTFLEHVSYALIADRCWRHLEGAKKENDFLDAGSICTETRVHREGLDLHLMSLLLHDVRRGGDKDAWIIDLDTTHIDSKVFMSQ
jgi:hypothetical protein